MADMDEVREFQEFQELFDLVVDLPDAERERVLHERGVTAEMRDRLSTMLQGAELPVQDPAASHDSTLLGHRAGPFRLVQLLGSGGMGAVYLAER
jgi:plasmid stability protein